MTATPPTSGSDAVEVREVDPARWPDFERLFESRGGPKWCWCRMWRRDADGRMPHDPVHMKESMRQRIAGGGRVGLLAYVDGEPAACARWRLARRSWASVGWRSREGPHCCLVAAFKELHGGLFGLPTGHVPHAVEGPQEGRLAGPGRPEHDDDLPALDPHVYVPQHTRQTSFSKPSQTEKVPWYDAHLMNGYRPGTTTMFLLPTHRARISRSSGASRELA